MRVLRFALALALAVVLHVAGVRLAPMFSATVDLFLVAALLNSLRGDHVGSLLGGAAAGLVYDGVRGGLYGLHGVANTVVAYAAALAAQRLVVQRALDVFLLFAVASVAQQLLVGAIAVALVPGAEPVAVQWGLARAVTTGLIGAAIVHFGGVARARLEDRRRRRRSRLRL